MGQLTEKKARFIQHYLVHRNGARAAREAGYSPQCARETAYRLLTNVHIRQELAREREATAKALQISREDVINALLEAAQDAQYHGNFAGMVAAWSEIGSMLGYYPTKRP